MRERRDSDKVITWLFRHDTIPDRAVSSFPADFDILFFCPIQFCNRR
jgi:hypothetical protein